MTVNGALRYYLLNVPSGYSSTTATPLLFVFHGMNQNNVWASTDKNWNIKAAVGNGAITVFPQGSGDPPGTSASFSGSSSWGPGDEAFFDALLSDIENKYCIDTSRVFSMGFSMGGYFTNQLGCDRSGVIRAIAPNSGWGPNSYPNGGTTSCSKSKGTEAAIVFHGAQDTFVNTSNGAAAAAFWARDNSCSTSTTPDTTYSGNNFTCVAYQGCPAGHEVVYCTFPAAHTTYAGSGSRIWQFFSSLPPR